MRIGVFGGSFDPVHLGHLTAARAACEALALDHVRFVPAREQPFKQGAHGAAPPDRVALLEAALAGDPRAVVDGRELAREGPSYTVDTLRALRAEFPADQLFLLVGADAARDLPGWHEAAALPALATVVALTRPGVPAPTHPFIGAHVAVPAIQVSATEIRARCARGATIRDLVPDAVRALIAARGLYREG